MNIKSRVLDVYFNSKPVGKLTEDKEGIINFKYNDVYLSSKDACQISVSMPLRQEQYEGNIPKAFFSGLLPDDIIRQRLSRYLGISEKNSFALLEAVGGECAGALSLYPEGEVLQEAKEEDIQILDDKSLKEILDLLKKRPLLAGSDDIRLSLAGAQDKIAVRLIEGKIAIIKGSAPTTHIIKPIIEGIKDSVHNEAFCMRLAKLLKIDVPNVEILWIDNIPYFLIERYDRIKDQDGNIIRLHQEDFCQALGIMPEFKYEREGGAGIDDCFNLIQNNSLQPASDRLSFINRLIFNYIIGNADAHSKNHSFLYKTNIPVLSPAYDIFSTAVYPEISTKMAMRIGKEYSPDKIFLRHWYQIIPESSLAKKAFQEQLIKFSKNCIQASIELKEQFAKEKVQSPILDEICSVIKKRVLHIQIMTE